MNVSELVIKIIAECPKEGPLAQSYLGATLAQALTAYAEEAMVGTISLEMHQKIVLNARNSALEEAANVADHMYYDQPFEIAKSIRALKTADGKGER